MEGVPAGTPYQFSIDAYYRAFDLGLLGQQERTELISGQIIHMSPSSEPHSAGIGIFVELCFARLLGKVTVRSENPIELTAIASVPQPDIALCNRDPSHYSQRHPSNEEVLFLVEVSLSSLEYDRTVKKALYEQAFIPEYWIVNLVDRQFECFTEPKGEAGYRTKKIYVEGDAFSHELLGEIVVSDLLPMPQTETPTTPPA